MPYRKQKFHRTLLTLLSLIVMTGQLSAYPLFCTMPGMEMHGMESELAMEGSVLADANDMGQTAEERGSPLASSSNAMINCEQVCGYCLSFNYSGSKITNPDQYVGSSQLADLYSRFTPSNPLKSLFRPPISV